MEEGGRRLVERNARHLHLTYAEATGCVNASAPVDAESPARPLRSRACRTKAHAAAPEGDKGGAKKVATVLAIVRGFAGAILEVH